MAQQDSKKFLYGGGAFVIIVALVALIVVNVGGQDQVERESPVASPVQGDRDLTQNEPEAASRTTPSGEKRADSRLGSSGADVTGEASAKSEDDVSSKKKRDKKRRRRSQGKQSGEEADEDSNTGPAKKVEPKRPF